MKSKFAAHFVFWFFFLPFVYTVLSPALVGEQAFGLSAKEKSYARWLVGDDRYQLAKKQTDAVTQQLFVDTGFIKFARRNAKHLDEDVKIGSSYWNDVCFETINIFYRTFFRITLSCYWLVGLLFFVFACFIDGYTRRKIAFAQMADNNALFFHLGVHTAIGLFGISFFLYFLPITISSLFYPLILASLGGAAWLSARNYQTGTAA